MVLSACGTAENGPEEPLASARFTAASTPSIGTTSPTAPPATDPASLTPSPVAPDAVAAVALLESTVDGLQLRTGPSLNAGPFVFPCNPAGGCRDRVVIDAGWTMVALGGPVAADGYDWYLVRLTREYPGSAHLGWAATPQTGDDWLVPSDYGCPSSPPALDGALELGTTRLLYCYGAEELVFDGYVVTGFGCNVMGTFEPDWLAHPCGNMSFISAVEGSNDRVFLHYPSPGTINPTLELNEGQGVRIRGHFDDPAAMSCVMEYADEAEMDPGASLFARDAVADVAQCRLRFVVTEVTVLPDG